MIDLNKNLQALKEHFCEHKWKLMNVFAKTSDFQCIKCGKTQTLKND